MNGSLSPHTKMEKTKLKRLVKKIQAVKCPPYSDDGKSIDEVIYSYKLLGN